MLDNLLVLHYGVSKGGVMCSFFFFSSRRRHTRWPRDWSSDVCSNDGVTIAKEIELEDKFENMGAQLVSEVASKTNEVAGDGTTTATVLAQAMIQEGLKNVTSGANTVGLRRGIEQAVEVAVEELGSISQPI